MAARGDTTAIRAVKTFARRNATCLLPMCGENHWFCVFLHHSSLVVLDSHPLATSRGLVDQLAGYLGSRRRQLPVQVIRVPPQVGSECGLHLLLNVIIFYETGFAPPPRETPVLRLQLLAPWFQAFAQGTVSRRILTHLCRALLRLQGDDRLPPMTFDNLSRTVTDGESYLAAFNEPEGPLHFQHITGQRRGRAGITLVLPNGERLLYSQVTVHALIPYDTLSQAQLQMWQAFGSASTQQSPPVAIAPTPSQNRLADVASPPNSASSLEREHKSKHSRNAVAAGSAPAQTTPVAERFHSSPPLPRSHQLYEDLLAGNVRVPASVRQEVADRIPLATFLSYLRADTPKPVSSLVAAGLAQCTQDAHQQNLRWVQKHAAPILQATPTITLDMALLILIERMESERNWAPTSTLTRLTSLQGALRILPLYRQDAPSILLKGCPRWLMALKGAQIKAVAHRPNQPRPITQAEAQQAWTNEKGALAAAIEMAWCSAGRVGDVLQLKAGDVVLQPSNMAVALRAGKTARKGGYGISVPLPSPSLQRFIHGQPTGQWLFPGVTGEQIRSALRRVNPQLEQRSLRRGRLQFLAAKQLPDAELLQLSRHGTVQMLRRYLDMGLKSADNARNAGRISEAERQ